MANFSWEQYKAFVAEGFEEATRNAELAAAVKDGREQGRKERFEIEKKRGEKTKEEEIVVSMYANMIPIKTIAKVAKLSEEAIRTILKNNGISA